MELRLLSLNTGSARVIGHVHGQEVLSAIGKKPVTGSVFVTRLGIEGDEQADLSVHGGPDKAVYAYPSDNWRWWSEEKNLPCGPATFGENLTLAGADEDAVAIGDRFEWGEALLEVSRPRSPCFKLLIHTIRTDVGAIMTRSARCGWYLRVLREGRAGAGGMLKRIRSSDGISVRDCFVALSHPDADLELLRRAYAQEELARSCRAELARKLRLNP